MAVEKFSPAYRLTVSEARVQISRLGLDLGEIDRQLSSRRPMNYLPEPEWVEYDCWRRRALSARGHIERERHELQWWVAQQQDDDLRSILRDLVDEFGEHEPCEGADCSACWAVYRAEQAVR